MKRFLHLSLLLVLAPGYTLMTNAQAFCATELPVKYSKIRQNIATINNLVTTLQHDLCVNKKFSVVFHVIAEQNGTWGAVAPSDLDSSIARLNREFRKICVTFMNCSTVVIPNYVYNDWEKPDTEKMVVGNWHTDNTINIYLPATITGTPSGYAYYPGGKDVIVVEKASVAGKTMIHEMGHFFGLPHTHDEIGSPVTPAPPGGMASYEFVSRTNCYANGDGFCDTEADCYPLPTGTKDGNNVYYVVPSDNYMSYHNGKCRFTQEQFNFMANVILTQRLYLH